MNKKHPRLGQPLFHKKYGMDYNMAMREPFMASFIKAYDAIWNLLNTPQDMAVEDIVSNAEINLDTLGGAIEKVLGDKVFETQPSEPEQLSFDLDNKGQ